MGPFVTCGDGMGIRRVRRMRRSEQIKGKEYSSKSSIATGSYSRGLRLGLHCWPETAACAMAPHTRLQYEAFEGVGSVRRSRR